MPRQKRTHKPRRKTNRASTTQMVPRVRSIRAAPQPKNQTVKLKWSTDLTITSLSSWRFGLAQFWNQIPGYFAQYMALYKMSRILQVHARVTVINTTAATPAELVACVLPYSDYSRTLAEAKNLPRAKFKYLSGAGGLDKVSLDYSAGINDWLGVDCRSLRDYQQSASEAASTLALLPDTPVLAVYVGGASTEPTLRVFLDVWYDVEFFELEYPGSMATDAKVPYDMTDRPDHSGFLEHMEFTSKHAAGKVDPKVTPQSRR